jgi:hypothetical protein
MQLFFLFCLFLRLHLTRKIYLFTQIPKFANQERLKEYYYCLGKNLNNQLVNKIYLINSHRPCIASSKLVFLDGSEDLSISAALRIANNISQSIDIDENLVAVVHNADIYFDDTILFLQPTHKFPIFLSRHEEILYYGPLYIGNQCDEENYIGSHDAFAFRLPYFNFLIEAVDFHLGTPGMEARMIYELDRLGLKVINSCKSVTCWHVHQRRSIGEYRFPVVNTLNRSLLAFPF